MTATICLKRILFPFLFSILLLASAGSVLAVDSTPSGSTTRKELVQQRVETRKATIQERIAATREKIASREAALKAKLENFRDQRKAQVAERVSMNLNKINEKMTLEMSRFLERVSALLAKLENRVNLQTPDIKNVQLAKEAIASASASIKIAEEAVNAQAEKDYTIVATSEARIKTDADSMRRKLHTDLLAARKLVVEAKQSVANAIRVAKTGTGLKEATTSGQQ